MLSQPFSTNLPKTNDIDRRICVLHQVFELNDGHKVNVSVGGLFALLTES